VKKILFFLLLFTVSHFTKADALYGGEITYTKIDVYTFKVKLTVYIFNAISDWDSLQINYGDGATDTIVKTSEVLIDSTLTSKLDFEVVHTYPDAGTYVISFMVGNRPADIKNINNGNSVNEPFYIEDSLFIYDPYLMPFDYNPAFTDFQTDITYDGSSLIHNSALIDSDADSITYELVAPLKGNGYPVTNYVLPNEMPGAFGTFTINDTGLIIWTSPMFVGKYCIAIKSTVWKYGWKMGTIIRDMTIVVNPITAVNEISLAGISPQVFPNPATSTIGLKYSSTQKQLVTLWKLNGEMVKSEIVNSYNSSIDIRQLSSGLTS
jgi:hypothetical protein